MRTNVELICDAFRVPFDPVRDVSVSGQECSYKVAIQSEYGVSKSMDIFIVKKSALCVGKMIGLK